MVTPRGSQLFLFQCSDEQRYALSTDVTGCNVPRKFGAWLLRCAVLTDDLPPDFEMILNHVAEHGFSILKVDEDKLV